MLEYNALTPEEARVIVYKEIECSGTDALLKNEAAGTNICRRCNAPLYRLATSSSRAVAGLASTIRLQELLNTRLLLNDGARKSFVKTTEVTWTTSLRANT